MAEYKTVSQVEQEIRKMRVYPQSEPKPFAAYADTLYRAGYVALRDKVEVFGTLWRPGQGEANPAPEYQVGQLIGQPLGLLSNADLDAVRFHGRPREAWLVVDILGGKSVEFYGSLPQYANDPLYQNGNYCYFAAIAVNAPSPEPAPAPKVPAYSDRLEEHLNRLANDD